jgi:hypothetical protein
LLLSNLERKTFSLRRSASRAHQIQQGCLSATDAQGVVSRLDCENSSTALARQLHSKPLLSKSTNYKQEIPPMKKLLIAVSAFALFAAYSGMARAEGDSTSTETKTETKAGGKKTKKTKKTDANADGTGSTETKTETTKTAK